MAKGKKERDKEIMEEGKNTQKEREKAINEEIKWISKQLQVRKDPCWICATKPMKQEDNSLTGDRHIRLESRNKSYINPEKIRQCTPPPPTRLIQEDFKGCHTLRTRMKQEKLYIWKPSPDGTYYTRMYNKIAKSNIFIFFANHLKLSVWELQN